MLKYLIFLFFVSSSMFGAMMDRAFDCIAQVYTLKPNVEINQNNFAHVVQLMKAHADEYIKIHPKAPDVVPTTLGPIPPPPAGGPSIPPAPTGLGGPKSPPRPSSPSRGSGPGAASVTPAGVVIPIDPQAGLKKTEGPAASKPPVNQSDSEKLVNLFDKLIPRPGSDPKTDDTGDGTNDDEW
jgi:hypothetical protein